MDIPTKHLPEPFLTQFGFVPCACKETLNLEKISVNEYMLYLIRL